MMMNLKNQIQNQLTRFSKNRIQEPLLFLLIILCQAVFFFYLISQRRMPQEHDTFHFMSLQYYFLNHTVIYGAIPQWIPFLTHGLIANGFYALQSGFLQNVLMTLGPVLKPFNFLDLFYLGMFVDELFLLTGTWLLAKRYFTSIYTVFFVCVSVIGSAIWVNQPWFNFRFYYAVPLILFFLHSFLDTGRWRYFFLGVNLIAVQTLGNLAYLIPFTTAAVFMYFLFYFLLNQEMVLNQLTQIKTSRALLIPALWIAASFLAAYAILAVGTDQVLYYGHLRNRDGTVTLENFLHMRPMLTRFGFYEIFFGLVPYNDYTVYTGLVAAFMAVLALMTGWDSRKSVFIFFLTFILFFSYGTFVSVFFFKVWPMMKYFRHIELTMSFFKLFICFLAGFGFESLFINHERIHRKQIIIAVSCLVISLGFYFVMRNPSIAAKVLNSFKSEPEFIDFLFRKFQARGFWIMTAGTAFSFLLFFNLKKWRAIAISAVLLIHVLDLFSYKLQSFRDGSVKLNDAQYKIFEFTKLPFIRSRNYSYADREPIVGNVGEFFAGSNARYWTIFAFLFKDDFSSLLQTDQWLIPFDNLIKAYLRQSIYDLESPPVSGFNERDHKLILPDDTALKKIGALDEDKIQLFSRAFGDDSTDELASNLTNPDYAGDILFLSVTEKQRKSMHLTKWNTDQSLSISDRLKLPYQIQQFNSNQLKIFAHIPENDSAWLYYSDVWHPFWKATVNGKPKKVFKANLAYKAVQLDTGKNEVHFYFGSKIVSFLHMFFAWHTAFWLLVLAWLIGGVCFGKNGKLQSILAATMKIIEGRKHSSF